jgi:amino acid transporter
MPLNAIAVTCVISALLLLISLGSSTALNAVISFTINSFYGSYMVSASVLLYRRIRGDIKESATALNGASLDVEYVDEDHAPETRTWGPWRVRGVTGTLINAYACIWMTFVLFWSSWPAVTAPKGAFYVEVVKGLRKLCPQKMGRPLSDFVKGKIGNKKVKELSERIQKKIKADMPDAKCDTCSSLLGHLP